MGHLKGLKASKVWPAVYGCGGPILIGIHLLDLKKDDLSLSWIYNQFSWNKKTAAFAVFRYFW
jgi:hypothetical protein